MDVRLIAWTHFDFPSVNDLMDFREEYTTVYPAGGGTWLSEFAGRACYESYDKPNPATATTESYLGNIIRIEHESVLEHSSVTFLIRKVSRSLTHELVRHRHFSFSQNSQRYIDQSTKEFVFPPALLPWKDHVLKGKNNITVEMLVELAVHNSMIAYEEVIEALKDEIPKKALRGAARAVLPEGTETDIVVTANHRALRKFFQQRISPGADQEIRELAVEMLRLVRANGLGDFYQDFNPEGEWTPNG